MDLDTVKYLRDLLLKGDSERALVILNAEIEDDDNRQHEEDSEREGHENEALADKHLPSMHRD